MVALALAGLLMSIGFLGMPALHDLRPRVVEFLALYGVACVGYAMAVWWSLRRTGTRRSMVVILAFAIVFRLLLLFTTPPTLSDDVYRYIWDGKLMNAGVNPYAQPVDSPTLDAFDSPQRDLVNHSWMASPYLPVAQLYFAAIWRLAPDSALAFQIAATILDLLTGLIVVDLLRRLGLPRSRSLIYLWHPLIVVEFAHGAHVDSLMIVLIMASVWAATTWRSQFGAVAALAAATLTKGLPALLIPILARRWQVRHALKYLGLVAAGCAPFALGAGWGLVGALDGRGLFGALRIYLAQWKFNSGLYHWTEELISGSWPSATRLVQFVSWSPALIAKMVMGVLMCALLVVAWRRARRELSGLQLVRLAVLPLAGYLLLTPTVHPWYTAIFVPLLPFLARSAGATSRSGRFLAPLLYFSCSAALSYLAYLDPASPRDLAAVRIAEYAPLFLLLIWAAWPASGVAGTPDRGSGRRRERDRRHA